MAFLGVGLPTLTTVGVFLAVASGVLSALAIVLSILGLFLVLIYRRNKTIVIPSITLFILDILEFPVKKLAWLFGIDEGFLDYMVVEIRNKLYMKVYVNTPYPERAIFLPQCLRNPKCPATLEQEGLICKSCGRCGIFKIKEYSEQLGYKFFIAPGSTLIKRMIKKYRPKAVLGVGCILEVYEGTRLIDSVGLPGQGIILERDGCVDTRIDVNKLMEKIKVNISLGRDYSIHKDPELLALADRISRMWGVSQPTEIQINEARNRTEHSRR